MAPYPPRGTLETKGGLTGAPGTSQFAVCTGGACHCCTSSTTGAAFEGSSMGRPDEGPGRGTSLQTHPRVLRISEAKVAPVGRGPAGPRRKRDVLLASGVKLCAQETSEQVVANHLGYFHLRGEEGRVTDGGMDRAQRAGRGVVGGGRTIRSYLYRYGEQVMQCRERTRMRYRRLILFISTSLVITKSPSVYSCPKLKD